MLLRLAAGLIGWAAAFCLLYALHGLGCAAGWERSTLSGLNGQQAALFAAWTASLAATLAIALRLQRRRTTALDRAAAATGWVGVAATAILLLPIVLVPACV